MAAHGLLCGIHLYVMGTVALLMMMWVLPRLLRFRLLFDSAPMLLSWLSPTLHFFAMLSRSLSFMECTFLQRIRLCIFTSTIFKLIFSSQLNATFVSLFSALLFHSFSILHVTTNKRSRASTNDWYCLCRILQMRRALISVSCHSFDLGVPFQLVERTGKQRMWYVLPL